MVELRIKSLHTGRELCLEVLLSGGKFGLLQLRNDEGLTTGYQLNSDQFRSLADFFSAVALDMTQGQEES